MRTLDRSIRQIGNIVKRCEGNLPSIGLRSTTEAIAIALLSNRPELLPDGYTHLLDAVDRLDDDWLKAAMEIIWYR